ncbi:MAG: transposase [Candidatus Parcubacteria bacterium]|nr:transposase [Candidatus Parcubacteria bacterium]
MRQEDIDIGSYVHVVKRGTRGLPIVRDDSDRFRFLLMLTHFNDSFASLNWYRDLQDDGLQNSLKRPQHWPARDPLVHIISFALVENHFHLLLQEFTEGGIARFMQKIGTGMAKRFNERYKEHGSLFQGGYRGKVVQDDDYFRYVNAYIQVKNVFDVHPKGYRYARDNFDNAYDWANKYPYASLGDYTGIFDRPVVNKEFLSSMYTPEEFREFAKDVVLGRHPLEEEIEAHQSGFFE